MQSLKRLLFLVLAGIVGGLISLFLYSSAISKKLPGFQGDNIPKAMANYNVKEINLPTFNFTEIAKIITPTVVHINTLIEPSENEIQSHERFKDFFEFFMPYEYNSPKRGSGSGVILSKDGYIVTNRHVIEAASKIMVTAYDKREYEAMLVGQDPQTDIAVLKIKADDLPFLTFGNSDELEVGAWVLAVGNPFNLTGTITAGIVSAKARNLNLMPREYSIESFIQTDAAVNPGNSGGALVNVQGQLVGINTAIASSTGSYEGYSFAIPANIVKKVVEDIIKYGKVQRALLGVSIRELTKELADENNMKEIKGVYVVDVLKGGAAEKAGIQSGDVILEVDGIEVNSVPELQELVSRKRPGNETELSVLHKGKTKEFTVVLKDIEGNTELSFDDNRESVEKLGAGLKDLNKDDLKKLNIDHGVMVLSVGPGKFRDAGIPKGFIITKIDKKKVFSKEDVLKMLENCSGGALIEGINPDGSKAFYGIATD
jgi:serine protease Do